MPSLLRLRMYLADVSEVNSLLHKDSFMFGVVHYTWAGPWRTSWVMGVSLWHLPGSDPSVIGCLGQQKHVSMSHLVSEALTKLTSPGCCTTSS